jgi:hypothetical protein
MRCLDTSPLEQQERSPAMTFAPRAMGLACAAIAAFGFAAGTPNAREVSKQPGSREILLDLAAGRNVSARISLPL